MPRYAYGGQALIEGVMMRGRDAIAVALRAPDGRIVWEAERLDTGFHKNPASRWPFIRGLVILYEQLVIGTRWLMRAASIQVEDEGVELGKGSIALMLLITAVIGVGLFFLLPLAVATEPEGRTVSPSSISASISVSPWRACGAAGCELKTPPPSSSRCRRCRTWSRSNT